MYKRLGVILIEVEGKGVVSAEIVGEDGFDEKRKLFDNLTKLQGVERGRATWVTLNYLDGPKVKAGPIAVRKLPLTPDEADKIRKSGKK